MSNLITSIIYAVMGAVIIVASVLTGASWEILGLGIAVTVFSIGCLVASLIKKKKSK